jgi:serine/threonine protein kinase
MISIVFGPPLRELSIVRMYFSGSSLSKVFSISPLWWTPTAKAKAVCGIVFGLRFAHSLGLQHGHLTTNNIFFNEHGVIQITDFCISCFGDQKSRLYGNMSAGGFSRERWTPTADVRAFTGILSEIVVDSSAERSIHDRSVPSFVSGLIERGKSAKSAAMESFADIVNILKENEFEILEGVDIREVKNFVYWIEQSETLTE